MLPDLRVVVFAVISTFLFTVSVGFYTSSRLMNEPRKARGESLAAHEDSPINRIALSWPEPVQPTSQLDLDFAVTLNGSRNPVRDVTHEMVETQVALKARSSQVATVDSGTTSKTMPAGEAAAKAEEPISKTEELALKAAEPAPTDDQPVSLQDATQDILAKPALAINPTMAGVALATEGAEALIVPSQPAAALAAMALVIAVPRTDTPIEEAERKEPAQIVKPDIAAEIQSEDPSELDRTGTVTIPDDDIPMPQARPERTASASEKAIIITKRPRSHTRTTQKRRRPRITPPAPAPTLFFPFNLFTIQPNQPNQTNQPSQASAANQTR